MFGLRPLALLEELEDAAYRAQVHVRDATGSTPLLWAVYKNDPVAVQALIRAGADVNAKDNGGYTALIQACRINGLQCARMLLEAGADVHMYNYHGHCLIHETTILADATLLSLLEDHGADINAQRPPFMTSPLMFAAGNRNAEAATYLLSRGAATDGQDGAGDTALHFACRANADQCLELLLRHGADFTITNTNGFTPLHEVALNADARTAGILAAADLRGLDVNARDCKGRTAADFLDKKADVPETFRAAFTALLEAIRAANMHQGRAWESDSDDDFMDAVEMTGEN